MRYFYLATLLLANVTAFAQITNVQCGDAATGTFIACPVTAGSPTVTAGGIDKSTPTTGAYVDFQWTTPNCSSSIVVYMRDTNFAPERYWQGNANGADGCGAGYAKNHSVHANYLSPSYTGLVNSLGASMAAYDLPNHFFYVASQDQSTGSWLTKGGPCQIDRGNCGASYPYGVLSPVVNTAAPSSWAIWTYGAQNVYQGHDLNIELIHVLAAGPASTSSVMPWSRVKFTRQTMADGSPCVTNCTDVQDGTVLNLDALYLNTMQYLNNPATDYTNYNVDNTNRRDWVYGGNYLTSGMGTSYGNVALRVRTNCNGHGNQAACGAAAPTPAGRYQVQATFQPMSGTNGGSSIGPPFTVTYTFTVLPSATFTATPPACLANSSCAPLPCLTMGSCGGFSYEDEIVTQGVNTCTGGSNTAVRRFGQDYSYSQGTFDNNYYGATTAQALALPWNYDGGRTFWQISDYAGSQNWATPSGASLQPGGTAYPDAASYFGHCALVAQQAYFNYFSGVGAAGTAWPGGYVREWNLFPNGPAMTWWRTGDPAARQAVLNLGSWGGTGGSHQGSTIYQYYPVTYFDLARQSAYQADAILAAWQVNGSISAADRLQLSRIVDGMLAMIDQQVNFDPYGKNYSSVSHPQTLPYGIINRNYMLGATLESLIEYYEWQAVAGVTQDQRIPAAVKGAIDWMWNNLWAASSSNYHAFYYNGVDLPHNFSNDNDNYPELNNLVCGAYAWYWKESGDNTYLTRGDDCFQNGIGPTAISHIWFTGKDFNQINKWAADYIGYRSVNGYTSSTFPVNNPGISVPDTVPPVPRPIVMTNLTTTDSSADTLSGVKPVTNITSSSVTVTWSTYKPLATATVEYGTSAAYGSSTTGSSINCATISACSAGCDTTVGTPQKALCKQSYWNVVNITGLLPATTYHFRTVGTDTNNNVAVTNTSPGVTGVNKDFTFRTK